MLDKPDQTLDSAQTTPGLLCDKCGFANPQNVSVCGQCGAHLYLACRRCGRGNLRTAKRCSHCGHPLHRSLWSRLQKKVFKRISLAQTAILVVALVVLCKVVWMAMDHFLGPPRIPDEPPVSE